MADGIRGIASSYCSSNATVTKRAIGDSRPHRFAFLRSQVSLCCRLLLAATLLVATQSTFGQPAPEPSLPASNPQLTPALRPITRPAVSVWTFLTNNRLILELRYLGLKRALRRQLDMGPLTIKGLARAQFKLVGTRRVDGETLPVVSIEYLRDSAVDASTPPSATLGSSHATVNALSLRVAARIYRFNKSSERRVLAHVEPGDMTMLVGDVTGSDLTNFGPIKYAVKTATIEASEPIFVRQDPASAALPRWSTGALEVSAADLKFDDLAFTFEGDNNALKVSGGVSLPNAFNWTYFLDRGTWSWNDGTIEIRDFQLLPVPQRPINFGGLTLELSSIKVGSAQVTRDPGTTSLPRVALNDISVDAANIVARHGLQGSLSAPLTIRRVDGQINIKNNSIEEGLNLAHLRAQDLSLKLSAMKYAGANGLNVSADSFTLALAEFKKDDSDDPKMPAVSTMSAHISLEGGSIQGPVTAVIEKLEADLRGPVDKFNGKGSMRVRLSGFSTTVDIDPTTIIKTLDCAGGIAPLQIDVAQIGSSTFDADVFFFDGLPTARTTADAIAVTFSPKYWRCEWDSQVAAIKIPTVTWDTPELKWDGATPYIDWGGVYIGQRDEDVKVHWIAELQPIPGAGAVLLPVIKIDKDGIALCGGHTAMVGGFWSPQVGPNFQDCGNFLCNIPRDALRTAWGTVGAPFGLITGSLTNLAVNSVGFFDAGLLGNRCR